MASRKIKWGGLSQLPLSARAIAYGRGRNSYGLKSTHAKINPHSGTATMIPEGGMLADVDGSSEQKDACRLR